MKIKSILTACLLMSTFSFAMPVSAVRVFSDDNGNKFLTSGQDSSTLSINTSETALTEDMFNNISSQAKKDGYNHILLSDSVLLDQNAAQRLALNFLTVAWDDYYNALIKLSDGSLFVGGATVKDVKDWIADKTLRNVYSYPFARPYLILPADDLVPSILLDIYVNQDYSSIGTASDKYLACREYYRTCDRHFLD